MTKRITGTKEWAVANENCISGCRNNCVYCYAKLMAIRYKRTTEETWKNEQPRLNVKPRLHKGTVMFPTTHDLHVDSAYTWLPFLERLIELGNKILIVSKPEYATIQLICEKFADKKDQIEFRFTIGTYDDEVRKYWEPNAPSIYERQKSLITAYRVGFKTSISMEPCLMDYPQEFALALKKYVTGDIWIGCMNHVMLDPAIPEHAYQIKINSREHMWRVYDETKDLGWVKYKDSVRNLLGV